MAVGNEDELLAGEHDRLHLEHLQAELVAQLDRLVEVVGDLVVVDREVQQVARLLVHKRLHFALDGVRRELIGVGHERQVGQALLFVRAYLAQELLAKLVDTCVRSGGRLLHVVAHKVAVVANGALRVVDELHQVGNGELDLVDVRLEAVDHLVSVDLARLLLEQLHDQLTDRIALGRLDVKLVAKGAVDAVLAGVVETVDARLAYVLTARQHTRIVERQCAHRTLEQIADLLFVVKHVLLTPLLLLLLLPLLLLLNLKRDAID